MYALLDIFKSGSREKNNGGSCSYSFPAIRIVNSPIVIFVCNDRLLNTIIFPERMIITLDGVNSTANHLNGSVF